MCLYIYLTMEPWVTSASHHKLAILTVPLTSRGGVYKTSIHSTMLSLFNGGLQPSFVEWYMLRTVSGQTHFSITLTALGHCCTAIDCAELTMLSTVRSLSNWSMSWWLRAAVRDWLKMTWKGQRKILPRTSWF